MRKISKDIASPYKISQNVNIIAYAGCGYIIFKTKTTKMQKVSKNTVKPVLRDHSRIDLNDKR